MNELPQRPDPDAILHRLKEEESRARRGKLRIFFGFAPGVGKTYRMLQVAHDRKQSHGEDVVVGVVETHKRAETERLVAGLPLLPRRNVDYRGTLLEELDLDAALARKPKVLLLDELAHTNAPGSRHPKRWQDALELLEAGIDVFTTVNVQHIESLNDAVAQITHVRVRETIPDAILDRADQIELVDISPEELLARLEDGKVYLPDQALRAAEHFFQRGNLLALRELALRRTAQHVDEDVLEYRALHGLTETWPASERVLVCVGPSPTSARLIRAAFRMAAGLRAPWIAAYVERNLPARMSAEESARLEAHLQLAESLGARVTRLSSTRVAAAVLDYAHQHNVTRIVVGKPTHSRLRDRLRGSLLDDMVRGSADIDVYVINGDEERVEPSPEMRTKEVPDHRGFARAAVLVAATTGIAAAARALLQVPDVEMLYLIAVMIAAMAWGRGPAVFAAALGVAAFDFFFVPPHFTFAVADAQHVLTFAMMFAVGLLISELMARVRRQQKEAVAREQHTAALYALSRDLAAAEDLASSCAAGARHTADVLQGRAYVLQASDLAELRAVAQSPSDSVLDVHELGVAKWSYEHRQMAGFGTATLPGARSICSPLRAGGHVLGVLALEPSERTPLRVEQREVMEAFSRLIALALERAQLSERAQAASVRAKTEETRASLLGAISHDLRTPLAAITGAATSLRDHDVLGENAKSELLETICEEAERLERLVANLLDMTRLTTGAVVLKRDWVPLEEIVGSALTRLDKRLGKRELAVKVPTELIHVDAVLLEQLFVNLLENALKYTPADSAIAIDARSEPERSVIEVRDHGPGLIPGSEEHIFEKFTRGKHGRVPGVGLGLAICRAIAEAHGGTIRAGNAQGGGALFTIELPRTDVAPAVAAAPEEVER